VPARWDSFRLSANVDDEHVASSAPFSSTLSTMHSSTLETVRRARERTPRPRLARPSDPTCRRFSVDFLVCDVREELVNQGPSERKTASVDGIDDVPIAPVGPPEGPLPAAPPAHVEDAGQEDNFRSREMGVALRNGLKMGGSLLITWSVAMIVKLHVPAHLGPVRQGHFGFAESFATMFFAMLGLGVDTHIMKEVAVRPKYASDVVGGVFAVRAALSFFLFAAMAATLWITGRSGDIFVAALVFGASNVLMAINGTLGAVLQAISRVGPAVVANIVTKVIWGGGLLVALHFDAPLWLLALPALVGEALRTAILLPATSRGADLRYRIDVPAVRHALLESIPYFVNALALGVLSSLGMSVLEFIRVDEREVGWFAAVQNLGYLCMLLSPLLFWVVMPLLSRAQARSEEEGMAVFRRCLEGIVVAIIPLTVLISAGSDVLVRVAFGPKYEPAHTGLSILSLVFIMTYMNMMLAMNLIVMRRGWSVTIISVSSVFITASLMFVFVPLGRHLIGEGGECAGAAAAVITSEACVLTAMLTRCKTFPLDARNLSVFGKSIGIGAAILIVDRYLRFLGAVRLPIEAVAYVALALTFRVVRIGELGYVVRLLKHRGDPGPLTAVAD
jgi:O-antigen/teichoic acid export membrane protein